MLRRLLGPGGDCDWRLAKAAMRKAAGHEIIKGADATLRKFCKSCVATSARGGPTPSDKRTAASDKLATSTIRTPSSSAKQPVKSSAERAADGVLAVVADAGRSSGGQLAPSELMVTSLCWFCC